MKSNPWGGGSAPSIQNHTDLPNWENNVIESIGRVIGFWGFKENHGRIWAYLYLNGPTNSKDLRSKLGISKGGMSMLLSDLESWGIITRITNQDSTNTQENPNTQENQDHSSSENIHDSNARIYKAHEDFSSMIIRVLQIREQGLISSTLHSLQESEHQAQTANSHQKQALQNMILLAQNLHQLFEYICSNEHSLVHLQQFIKRLPQSNTPQKNSYIPK